MSNATTIIGGIDYINKNQAYVIPYLICYFLITINGILGNRQPFLNLQTLTRRFFPKGNLLILFSIITIKDMHTTANMLIFNLATIDFLISSFVDPFTIAGIKIKFFAIKPLFDLYLHFSCISRFRLFRESLHIL